MANSTGEMPFLDHLEELRKRILLSLVAIMAGFGIGWWLTTHFELIKIVEAPVAPFVPGGKLTVLTLTSPFMIVLKFAFILGVVLASPFVIYQLWLFLSPALTPREKKAIVPSLGVGFLLFTAGVAIGWYLVVPPGVAWLATYQLGTFTTQFTYDSYMQLVVHLLVGMGISAELPLVMILLASLGIMSYRTYSRFRRYAVLLAFIGGAILAPTPEVTMMILFTIPLLLLYEVGVFGAWLIEKRRSRAAAKLAAGVLLFAFSLVPHRLQAQVPPPPPQRPPGAQDTGRKVTGQGLRTADSGTLKRLGLPSGPAHPFATSADRVMQALLAQPGFTATRYAGDSVRYEVDDGRMVLGGHAATLRDDAQLEADLISYDNARCELLAAGEPRMFPKGQSATIGITMRVDICTGSERGVVDDALTTLAQGGTNWFIRGNLAVDSGGKRTFVSHAEFTSCDLPVPHYHFVAGQVKWVSQSVIVARPAVLYIRDVPVAWLPFIFQDTKRDRSSGILIPRFGFNDIVRTNRTYNRTVSNIGYYWAPSDYIDATAAFDWYANRYSQLTGNLNYRWLDRFITGSLTLSKQLQSDGASSNILHWDHQQNFDVATSLHLNLNYQSNSTVQLYNAIDPLASTQLITSQVNLTKRFRFGTVTFGGTRSQQLGGGPGTMTLPQLSIQPKPIALSGKVIWSPGLTVTNLTGFNNPLPLLAILSGSGVDSSRSTSHQRTTTIDFATPLEIGTFSWQNRIAYQDQQFVGRTVHTETGADSVPVSTVQGGNYSSGLNWDTGINLPLILRGTWKVTPSIGITNVTSGPFLVRTPSSNGNWVAQGKKVQVGVSLAPTFFGFTNGGIGPFSRLRYTAAPAIQVQWSPAATVPAAYAKANALTGGQSVTEIPQTALASISLHQTFEGKVRQPATDTNTDPIRLASLPKTRLFSLSTSPVSYDFHQATLPHRTGWTTSVLTNSFESGLLPGFNFSTTHSLWDGQVGTDSAKFSPFLASMNASLQLTGATFRSIGRFLHLVRRDSVSTTAPAPTAPLTTPLGGASAFPAARQGGLLQQQRATPRGFSASLTYSLTRIRPNGTSAQPVSTEPGTLGSSTDPFGTGTIFAIPTPPAQSQLGIQMSFAPTPLWGVSLTTQYDITHGTFQSQQIMLQRDLHDWRASFTFAKNPNGNFALYFSVYLINLPDIKFDYNQTTLQRAPGQP